MQRTFILTGDSDRTIYIPPYPQSDNYNLQEMCTLEKRGSVYILTLTGKDDHRINPSRVDSISSALRRVRSEITTAPFTPAALVTTGEGMFFSNGCDFEWAQSDKHRYFLMMSKIRSLMTEVMSLPMPTIAAVNGHATCAGYVLALSHDYVFMRKDHGFLYMNGLDRGVVLTSPFFMATFKAKISSPALLRDIFLTAEKMTAKRALEKGIIDAAYDTVEETVAAAVELGEQLVKRNSNGQVYEDYRKLLFHDVLHQLGVAETEESLKNSRVPIKELESRL